MRHLLSNFFLIVFIFLFAVPPQLMAQNTWTPPTQPAVGGNTPSPINVSEFAQKKRGRLTVDGEGSNTSLPGLTSRSSSLLRGTSVFDAGDMPGASPGLNMMLSWVKSYFMSNVSVGSQGTVGPEIRLNGQLYYKPLALDGSISGNQPAQGALLSVIDANGKVGYTPVPANDGDTLIWDSTCNCWTTGPGGGNGTTTPSGLPVGVFGQTTWYNASNTMEATSQITHGFDSDGTTTLTRIPNKNIYVGSLGLGKTTILSPITDISGTNSVNIGVATTGQTNINSPQVTFVEPAGNNFFQTVDVKSKYVNFTAPPSGADSQVVDFASKTVNFDDGAGQIADYQTVNVKSGNTNFVGPTVSFQDANGQPSDYQTVNVKSGNVNFAAPDDGGYQTVTFESDAVKLKNINMNPGQGRIPYSADSSGNFKWNDKFTYKEESIPGIGQIHELRLRNAAAGQGQTPLPTIMTNEGLTLLQDDVYVDGGDLRVTDAGDLYLDGLSMASPLEIYQDKVKQLCYVEDTKKIVKCEVNIFGQVPDDSYLSPVYDNDFEILRTSRHNPGNPEGLPSSYTFQSPQTVNIEWCGGGGGGGGGGLGLGDSGGGGGGGAKGQCHSQDVNVLPGDTLTWEIGEGGTGGVGGLARKMDTGAESWAANQNGSNGGQTKIFLSSGILQAQQLGPTSNGGNGGIKGRGLYNIDPYNPDYPQYVTNPPQVPPQTIVTANGGDYAGGRNGNFLLPQTPPQTWFHGYMGTGNGGGEGGDGEWGVDPYTSANVNPYYVANPNGSFPANVPFANGAGGKGGVLGQWKRQNFYDPILGQLLYSYISGVGSMYNRFGGDGSPGPLGSGGGGGGGGHKDGPILFKPQFFGTNVTPEQVANAMSGSFFVFTAPVFASPSALATTLVSSWSTGFMDDILDFLHDNAFEGPGGVVWLLQSGKGGKGGSGYVKITNVMNNAGSNGQVWSSPQHPTNTTIPFGLANIPNATNFVTIEIWGGGGGGGGVKVGPLAQRQAGGGGAGGYMKIQNIPKCALTTSPNNPTVCASQLLTEALVINVGAGGSPGEISGSCDDVTNGGNGSASFIKKANQATLVSIGGGNGGSKHNYGGLFCPSTPTVIPGGTGGTGVVNNTGVAEISAAGGNGLSNNGGSGGGTNTTGGSLNNGGTGAKTGTTGYIGAIGGGTDSAPGVPGRVRISWEI